MGAENLRQLLGRFHTGPFHARLSMNAHSNFYFLLTQRKAGLSHAGQHAGRHCHAHGAGIVNHLLGQIPDIFQALTRLRSRTGNFMDKYSSGNAAPTGGIYAIGNSHIIFGYHRHNLVAFHFGQFSCHSKVHNVAGVVLYNQQDSLFPGHLMDRAQNPVRRRRCKHIPRYRRIQHALSHIAGMGRLMTASTA